MAYTPTVWSFILLSVLVAYLSNLPEVESIPANLPPPSNATASQTESSPSMIATEMSESTSLLIDKESPGLTLKVVNTTTNSTSTSSPNVNPLSVEPGEFFVSAADDAPPVTDATWMYYLRCGHSTSETLQEAGSAISSSASTPSPSPDPQGPAIPSSTSTPSSSPDPEGPACPLGVTVNPDDDQGQDSVPSTDVEVFAAAKTRRANIYPDATPGLGSWSLSSMPTSASSKDASITAIASTSDAATDHPRRDSGDSDCSYIKCLGTASCETVDLVLATSSS